MKRCMEIACHNATFFLTCFWVTFFFEQWPHFVPLSKPTETLANTQADISTLSPNSLKIIRDGNQRKILQPHVSTLFFHSSSCTISLTMIQRNDEQSLIYKGERQYLTHIWKGRMKFQVLVATFMNSLHGIWIIPTLVIVIILVIANRDNLDNGIINKITIVKAYLVPSSLYTIYISSTKLGST